MTVPTINMQVALFAKANRECDIPGWCDALGATWLVIDETNDILDRLNKPVFDKDQEEPEVVFLMLLNALSDITSAIYTLSSGWIRPAKTALRGALETIATAVTIHHDAEKMARFMNPGQRLNIPGDVITPAQQHLTGLGRLYGILTNQWTHETFDTTARSINDESQLLALVPEIRPAGVSHYLNALVEAASLAHMVGVAAEICFPSLVGPEVHFAPDASGVRVRAHAKSIDALNLIALERKQATLGA